MTLLDAVAAWESANNAFHAANKTLSRQNPERLAALERLRAAESALKAEARRPGLKCEYTRQELLDTLDRQIDWWDARGTHVCPDLAPTVAHLRAVRTIVETDPRLVDQPGLFGGEA